MLSAESVEVEEERVADEADEVYEELVERVFHQEAEAVIFFAFDCAHGFLGFSLLVARNKTLASWAIATNRNFIICLFFN